MAIIVILFGDIIKYNKSETRAGKGVRRPAITHRVKYLLLELQKV